MGAHRNGDEFVESRPANGFAEPRPGPFAEAPGFQQTPDADSAWLSIGWFNQ